MDIFYLISETDIFRINELTLILKMICLCDVRPIMMLQIKHNIVGIKCVNIHYHYYHYSIRITVILVIMSISTFKTDIIATIILPCINLSFSVIESLIVLYSDLIFSNSSVLASNFFWLSVSDFFRDLKKQH